MSEYAGEQHINIHVPADSRGGVWANFAAVAHSPYEFTLDFVRMEYASETEGELPGVLVARVNLSPLLVTQLIDALQENWERYASKALPRDFGDEEDPSAEW